MKPSYFFYNYKGKNKHGALCKGTLRATSLALAKAELHAQGIFLSNIKLQKKWLATAAVKNQHITQFARQMATLLTAGIPIIQALEIVGRTQEAPLLENLIFQLKTTIEQGHFLSEALAQHPTYFNRLFCSLVASGEASGTLDTMLARIATYKEKMEHLKRKIKKALFYPVLLLIVALLVSLGLLIFVIPQFEILFRSFDAELPRFTQLIIHLSGFLQAWGGWIGSLLLFLGLVFNYFKKNSLLFNYNLDRWLLRIPIIGSLSKKMIIANFSRTLAISFAAGIPLPEAVKSTASSLGNAIYTEAVYKLYQALSVGSPLASAMRSSQLFPNIVVQLISIGEESGNLDTMLAKVATIFEEEVDLAFERLSSLLEPLLIVILSLVVGGLVIALYLPIFKMGSVL